MAEKIGALVMDLAGFTLTAEETELLQHPLVGGVILFARNYENTHQLYSLCQAIRRARKSPILIMVDQEGGRVQRFIHEFTRIPAMYEFGECFDQDQHDALHLTKEVGWLLASELRAVDIDITLGPILDLYHPISSVIAKRAFHADPHTVVKLASAFIAGMQEAGMVAVGKHFPGHGSVAVDSHHGLPVDARSFTEIQQKDLLPFAQMIAQDLHGMLAAHLVFPAVDEWPVGYSKIWLQDILRGQLNFRGCVFSDDLSMEGANISQDYVDRVVAARSAGCDFILICNQRAHVIRVLDQLSYHSHLVEKEKWGWFKSPVLADKLDIHENPRWQRINARLSERVTVK